jgi:hypothetical protein
MMIAHDSTHVSDVTTTYGKTALLSSEEIEVIVCNSQAIEGYTSASKDVKERMQALMKKHNVKVSF